MKKTYKLEDLDCAHCAAKMEKAIAKLDGVEAASISFLSQKLTITFKEDADIDTIMKNASAICKKVEPDCRIIL